MKPKLSIIIPAYNEEKRIGKTLDEFTDFFGKKSIKYEILVVMDGCTDRTPEIVKQKAKKDMNVRYDIHPGKSGKGGAVMRGFRLVKGDYVAYTDADGSTPPEELFRLLTLIGRNDGVIGSRWMRGPVVAKKQGLMRRVASRGFNLMTRLVLGLEFKDTQCPAKIFRKEVIYSIIDDLKVANFAMDACMLYAIKKKGYVVKEIAIRWEDKPLSSLKMGRTVWRMFLTVIKTRLGW